MTMKRTIVRLHVISWEETKVLQNLMSIDSYVSIPRRIRARVWSKSSPDLTESDMKMNGRKYGSFTGDNGGYNPSRQ